MRGSSTTAVDGSDLVMTRAEFARHRGVKQPYVNKLIDQGVLSGAALLRDGRIVVKIAEAQIARHTDPTKGPKGRPVVLGEADSDATYAVARGERERIRRQLDQLELDRQLGRVVDVADVREASEELAELLRQGLEQLAPQLVQAITGAPTAQQKDRAARAALERWRADFADLVLRRYRELTADG
jgi:hypothetical protein